MKKALIPLRGGSKSIPKKNIKLLLGKPLFYWTAQAALSSEIFDEVWVSTDDLEIKACVNEYLPQVKVLDRPKEFATDEASTEAVLFHFAENVSFDVLCLIQATSPLLEAEHLREASQVFFSGFDSLLSVVAQKKFYWRKDGTPINYDPKKRPRRQEHAGTLEENGAFYFMTREILLKERCRLGGRVGVYEMPEHTACEIDEPYHWSMLENLMAQHKKSFASLRHIKMVVCDVDGTLTDGGIHYGATGETGKTFNTKDWMGLDLLRKKGLEIVFITGEESPSVKARLLKLGYQSGFFGVQNKKELLSGLIKEKGFTLENVAYIGDDINDLACMQDVGFSVCPQDAAAEIKSISHYVCKAYGGHGAVREATNLIYKNLV